MTRFKELRRIQFAIQHRNVDELKWALGYCGMRRRTIPSSLSSTLRRAHEKHWRKLEKRILGALGETSD